MEVIKEQNYLRGALDQVNERFSSLDARIDSLESRIVSVENRMISLEACVSEVQSRLSRKIRDNLRWLIGMMIPVWFGILVAIIVELVKG
jgi:uncharacterized coiled-coil protein SlyX